MKTPSPPAQNVKAKMAAYCTHTFMWKVVTVTKKIQRTEKKNTKWASTQDKTPLAIRRKTSTKALRPAGRKP